MIHASEAKQIASITMPLSKIEDMIKYAAESRQRDICFFGRVSEIDAEVLKAAGYIINTDNPGITKLSW